MSCLLEERRGTVLSFFRVPRGIFAGGNADHSSRQFGDHRLVQFDHRKIPLNLEATLWPPPPSHSDDSGVVYPRRRIEGPLQTGDRSNTYNLLYV